MKQLIPLRATVFIALALIALQSVLPLAGELMAQRGWISSAGMQVICSSSGVKFIKTAPLTAEQALYDSTHIAKCPWCQLGEPSVLPSGNAVSLKRFENIFVVSVLVVQSSAKARWLSLPARAPPALAA